MKPHSPMTETPDARLLEAAWIRPLARHLVFDGNEVDDVIQDAWVKLLEARPGSIVDPKRWFASALRGVAANKARGNRSRTAREKATARAESVEAQAECHQDLVAQVLKLDEPYKTTVLLRYFEGLAPREIAKQQGVPVGTVKSQLHRALGKLRVELDGEYGDRNSWALAILPLAVPVASRSAVTVAGVALAALLGVWIAQPGETKPEEAVVEENVAAAELTEPELEQATVLPAEIVETEREEVVSAPTAPVPDGPHLIVVDFVTGERLENVSVRAVQSEGLRLQGPTDAAGRLQLHEGDQFIWVEAPDYLGRVAFLDRGYADSPTITLELARSARIEVEVLGADGLSAEGVEIGLAGPLEPVPSKRQREDRFDYSTQIRSERQEELEAFLTMPAAGLAHAFEQFDQLRYGMYLKPDEEPSELEDHELPESPRTRRTEIIEQAWPPIRVPAETNASGIATFVVPAGPAYGVNVTSVHPLDGTEDEDQLIAIIDLEPGEVEELTSRMLSAGTLEGRIDFGSRPWITPPVLSLGYVESGQLNGLQSKELEDGSFRFDLVRPGDLLLSIGWRSSVNETVHLRHAVTLEPGGHLDLGSLSALDTTPIELELGFVDEEGHLLEQADVFDETSPFWESSSAKQRGEAITQISAKLEAKAKRKLWGKKSPWSLRAASCNGAANSIQVLHGLPEGAYTATAFAKNWASMHKGLKFKNWSDHQVASPSDSPALVHMPVIRQQSKLKIALPDGADPDDYWFWVTAYQGKEFKSERLQEGSECPLPLQAGEAHLVVTTFDRATIEAMIAMRRSSEDRNFDGPSVWKDVPNYCFSGPIQVKPGKDVRVTLEPATTITGRVTDSQGNPFPGREIDFQIAGHSKSCFETFTDRDGRFRATGLPPNAKLTFERGIHPGEFETGAVGEALDLELTALTREEWEAMQAAQDD